MPETSFDSMEKRILSLSFFPLPFCTDFDWYLSAPAVADSRQTPVAETPVTPLRATPRSASAVRTAVSSSRRRQIQPRFAGCGVAGR